MASKVLSIAEVGGQTHIITIECHISNGLPAVVIVGFANRAVDEAKERLKAAFQASKISFPKKRVTINLAPADLPKDSSGFDMAMAVAIMRSASLIEDLNNSSTIFIGELGLDGSLRAVRGIIGKIIAAKTKGFTKFYIPKDNLAQAKLIAGIELVPVESLSILYLDLAGTVKLRAIKTSTEHIDLPRPISQEFIDLADISGQDQAKRVLEIAAAGGHNVLFNGPPGTGKSMLAKALPGILPDMQLDEVLEVTHLHSLANNNYDQIINYRPFRSPHHSASEIAIIGGGQYAKPGEISLAHRGVLFLDELPEYNRSTIEALRQPLEDKVISVARAKQNSNYPANFMLVATSNPCPCGFFGTNKNCNCLPHMILQYQRKLSGPIIDRIDLYTEVDQVDHQSLMQTKAQGETSEQVRRRIARARQTQTKRYGTPAKTNATLSNKELKKYAFLTETAQNLLNQAAQKLDISARNYMRLVKVARTIADLEASQEISLAHISEAIQYRRTTTNF